MIMQIMINFPKFDLCTEFEVTCPRTTELRAKEVGGFSIMLMGKRAGRHLFANQHGCPNIYAWRFLDFEQSQIVHLFVYRPEICIDFSKWLY